MKQQQRIGHKRIQSDKHTLARNKQDSFKTLYLVLHFQKQM